MRRNGKRGVWLVIALWLSLAGCGPSQEEYTAKVNEAENYKKTIAGKENELKQLRTEKQTSDQQLAAQQTKIEALQIEQQKTAQLLEQKEQELKLHQDQLTTIQATQQDAEAEIQIKKQAVEEAATALHQRQQDLEIQINAAHQANMQLKKATKDQEEKIKALNQEIDYLTNQIEILATEKQSLQNTLSREPKPAKPEKSATIPEGDFQAQLQQVFGNEIQQERLTVLSEGNRVILRVEEHRIFDSGEAFINAEGFRILNQIGHRLKEIPGVYIQVSGHTDDLPVGKNTREKFPTNWELSTSRAVNVVRYLIDSAFVDPSRISAAGYSSYRPATESNTQRKKNRRIEFVLYTL
ncbi:MAG: OmpA family protein [SAR324 cluster bacterium]|nr:OmpA family protein [SAR324 cluster bacterium]